MGTLSQAATGRWQEKQCDPGRTIDMPRGIRAMQTFAKLPSSAPSTAAQTCASGPPMNASRSTAQVCYQFSGLRSLVCTVSLMLASGGCGRAEGDAALPRSALIPAAEAEPVPVDVARAASDPDELRRAVTARHRDTAARLGAHRARGTASLRVTQGGREVEGWDEETLVEKDAQGAVRALYTNSRDYGREAIASGGRLWIRPKYGKFHRRPVASPDEPLRLADETYGTLGAHFDLVAHAVVASDGGATEVDGRPARRVTLLLGAPRPRVAETLPQRAWRDRVVVKAVAGEVTLDAATGTVLDGRLLARVAFVREGRTYELELEATHRVGEIGGPVAVAIPADAESVDTPGRSRDFDDREELLEGIAPPARRAPTPDRSAR